MMGLGEKTTKICDIHGEYLATAYKFQGSPRFTMCDKCAEIKSAEQQKQRQLEEAESYRVLRMNIAQIPPRFAEKDLSNYEADAGLQSEVLEFCEDYAGRFAENLKSGSCLMLLGLVGTGKTHLAIGILKTAINSGFRGRYMTVSRIMRDVKDTFAKHSESSEGEVLAKLISTDLLVIDEIGVQRANEFEANTLFEVINGRYEAIKPTILIANLTLKEMRESVGDRVFDRMRENGGRAFVMDWKSKRGAK